MGWSYESDDRQCLAPGGAGDRPRECDGSGFPGDGHEAITREQFGVIFLLDQAGELDLPRGRRLIAERIPAVPRLRQRLLRAPFGCGGPIWVDHPGFDICSHVRAVACIEPEDEQALLDTALFVIVAPLRRSAPLWSAVLVTGLSEDRVDPGQPGPRASQLAPKLTEAGDSRSPDRRPA
jgi:Wax ester synthase-like Acyl-CoA acyltransferase domain